MADVIDSLPIEKLIAAKNIAALLDDGLVAEIGQECVRGYRQDKESRSEWEQWYGEALNVAMQVTEPKTDPWPGCSNVAFPLVTIAGLIWHSQAYPALVPPNELVKCRSYQKGIEALDKSMRVERHMTFQLLEQDDAWEAEHDRGLLHLPIVGTMFKKCYFNVDDRMIRGDMVLAADLVVDYYTKSLDTCPRASHVLNLYRNDIYSREVRGLYLPLELGRPTQLSPDEPQAAADRAQKITPPPVDGATPFKTVEQHCFWDLDDDGYAEPYIVTFDEGTGQVRRIVASYLERDIEHYGVKIVDIRRRQYFVKYGLIPSPDGGFYDLGLGRLLGPINKSVQSAINMLFDAGKMHILGGGFLGKGARIRSGDHTFKPFEWKRVDSTGDDLRKNIVPLDTREPSQIVFMLAQWLVTYAERIAGATEIQVGENPGQNTPAETTRTLDANGRRIFTGTYKRVWRAMKEEFQLHFDSNTIHLRDSLHFKLLQTAGMIQEGDYDDPVLLRPGADPHWVSNEQRRQNVKEALAYAQLAPGKIKVIELAKRGLRTIMPDWEEIWNEEGQPPPNLPMLELQLKQQDFMLRKADLEARNKIALFKAGSQHQLTQSKIEEIKAKILKILAEIEESGHALDIKKTGQLIALMNVLIGAAESHADDLLDLIKIHLDERKLNGEGGSGAKGGMAGVAKLASHAGLLPTLALGGQPGQGIVG